MQHLTQEERYHIYFGLKGNQSISSISRKLGRSKSTICEEIKRNKGQKGYRPKQAHQFALERWQETHHNDFKISGEIAKQVDQYLALDWSPEQIANYMSIHHNFHLHHETIYQYILRDKHSGGELFKHLRRSNRKYKKRYGSSNTRGQIRNRIDIDERPGVIEERAELGHWEGDTVHDKKNNRYLITLVERKTRMTLIEEVPSLHANVVADAIIKKMKPYKDIVASVTLDNGKEFAQHSKLSKSLNTAVFFAKPYQAWQRGTNENTNGLIRQYFPKRNTAFERKTKSIIEVESLLNNRPRKILKYKTPWQSLKEHSKVRVA